jgi:hypothetical protein
MLWGWQPVATLEMDIVGGGDAVSDSAGELLDCRRDLSVCPVMLRNF